jgi:SRSO17 transposase
MARQLAPPFTRSPSRPRVMAYLHGLLSETERKHRWHVAEVCGEPTPDGFPSLLARADWDADAVCDALRIDSSQQLGDSNGVLVLDDTGCVTTGRHATGMARQYTGTVGTVEH